MEETVSGLLANLPSRGLFSSSPIHSSNLGGMRVYVCEHDTSPPEEQVIKTNQMNILIRSLTIRNQMTASSSKDVKSKPSTQITRGKRAAEESAGVKVAAKRANLNNSNGSAKAGGSTGRSSQNYQALTVEKLRVLLKERGLPVRGRKDELIARLKGE